MRITDIRVKPACTVAISVDPSGLTFTPSSYTVTGSVAGEADYTATVAPAAILTTAQLKRDTLYSFTVSATDGTHSATSDPATVTVSTDWPASQVLRQRLFDILDAAPITHGGKTLTLAADEFRQPIPFVVGRALTIETPALEVGHAILTDEKRISPALQTQEYTVTFRLYEQDNDTNTAPQTLQRFAEAVKAAIGAVPNLGLASYGIFGKAWVFSEGNAFPTEKTQLTGLEFSIKVTMNL